MPRLEERIAAHRARGEENLRGAELSLEAKLPNAAASRFYYAMYHGAIAFLLRRYSGGVQHDTWNHGFVLGALSRGAPRWRTDYADALRLRHEADYIPLVRDTSVSLAAARRLGKSAREFYHWVEGQLT